MGRLFDGLITLMLASAIASPAYVIAKKYETALWPVVAPLQIVRTERVDDDTSLVWVEFDKLRDCEYLGISWFDVATVPIRRVRLKLRLTVDDDNERSRPTGHQASGPWRVGMPQERLLDDSFITVSHRCHPLYPVRTAIYGTRPE